MALGPATSDRAQPRGASLPRDQLEPAENFVVSKPCVPFSYGGRGGVRGSLTASRRGDAGASAGSDFQLACSFSTRQENGINSYETKNTFVLVFVSPPEIRWCFFYGTWSDMEVRSGRSAKHVTYKAADLYLS